MEILRKINKPELIKIIAVLLFFSSVMNAVTKVEIIIAEIISNSALDKSTILCAIIFEEVNSTMNSNVIIEVTASVVFSRILLICFNHSSPILFHNL